MAYQPEWKSLIRYRDPAGSTCYGEPSADLRSANIFEGPDFLHLSRTERHGQVAEVLAPYVPDTILCIGLNYLEHAAEGGMTLPKFPIVFHKSKNSVTGPFSAIEMHDHATNVDYENELCFVVCQDVKDVSEEDAPQYILAYTIGNDVSSRAWQMPDTSGGQFSYAKSFDGFCPIGPRLVAASQIANPQSLNIVTRRSGKVVQNSNTSDMLFGVYKLLSFLSAATTVPAGALVMTGTPPGVAMFATKPPHFLQAGEVVECEIEEIGSLVNEFRSPKPR